MLSAKLQNNKKEGTVTRNMVMDMKVKLKEKQNKLILNLSK